MELPGQHYPPVPDVPLAVQEAREAILTIPESYRKLLPNPNLSVNEFIQFPLPSISGNILASCHETYFSSPLLTLILGPQCPISTFESILIFRSDFNSTSIHVWTFETVKTSLITLLPVVVCPVGSPCSPHPGESKTTTHICTLTVQNVIPQSIEAPINPMT